MNYELGNAKEMNLQFPDTFDLPDLSSLELGSSVKLCFIEKDKNPSERMWVTVSKIKGNKLEGKLNNTPYILTDLKYGDLIKFNKDNIYSIFEG